LAHRAKMTCTFVLALVFIGLGIASLVLFAVSHEGEFRYDDVCPVSPAPCAFNFTIGEDLEGTIVLQYKPQISTTTTGASSTRGSRRSPPANMSPGTGLSRRGHIAQSTTAGTSLTEFSRRGPSPASRSTTRSCGTARSSLTSRRSSMPLKRGTCTAT
jgi:hypothetical protein